MPESPPACPAPSVAVLFDIDGTLLSVPGAGRRAFRLALRDAFGLEDDIAHINFSGATDLDVLDRLLARAGVEADAAHREAFFRRLAARLDESIRLVPVEPHPGAAALLERLAARPEVVVGLVTGNDEACAWIKLRHAGLHGHFLLGAFGQEHGDRLELARRALERVRRLAPRGAPLRVLLVGDTPSDVAAARHIGAAAVAVATGQVPAGELAGHRPDVLLRDLSDTGAVLAAMGLRSP